MSQATALRDISLLEEVFLIKRVPAWSRNVSSRVGRASKVAFVDSGIAANLLGADSRSLIRPGGPFGPPSTITAPGLEGSAAFEARLAELTAEPVAETDELRNQALRRMLTRRLLDDPVVYYDELTEDERAYLVAQRHNITGRISEATGLLPELRAKGIAMVDPDDELTDVRMPEQRTDGHVTLLVAEYLAGRGRAPRAELLAFVRRAAQAHASYWRKGVTDPGAETELLEVALEKLTALRLIEVDIEVTRDGTGTLIRSRPAIARFALAEPTIREPGGLPRSRTGTSKTGTSKTGTSQTGTSQTGTSQTGKATANAASTLF